MVSYNESYNVEQSRVGVKWPPNDRHLSHSRYRGGYGEEIVSASIVI